MDGICYIVGAGSIADVSLKPRPQDFVIAADGGLRYLTELGIRADLVLGDFDSLGYRPDHENVICLPAEKDDTDMSFAVKVGLERGYRRFVLSGGLGGRLDHTLANLQTLAYLAGQGARGYLVGDGLVAAAIRDGSLTLAPGKTGYISVFCNSGTAEGVTLEGLKYPLKNARLTGDCPLGVSNEFTGAESRITVEKGTLLVLWWEKNPELFPQ